MSGVELKTIADYQAAIKQLDRNNPQDLAKIKEYTAKIGELLSGAGAVQAAGGDLNIAEEMGFRQNNRIADEEVQNQMGAYSRDGAGSKNAAKDKIKNEFGAGALDDNTYKAKKNELKAAQKELKNLEKQARKIKYDKNNPEAYATAQREIQPKIAAQRSKVAQLEDEMVDIEASRRGGSNKFAKKYEKAAHKNYEQYEETQDVQFAFLNKKEAKEYVEKHPEAKGHTTVVNNNDMEALTKLYLTGRDAIAEAEATGDETKIAQAKERYSDYVDIFGVNDKGEVDYTKINVPAVQNILVDKSGGDQNFNLDEVGPLADALNMSKGEVKHLAKTFGFGRESALPTKLKAAGITAAATALSGIFTKKHSHQKAEANATAQGETVQGEVNWIASNGESFYHYYEAQGGEAACNVVAEACAKVPVLGNLAGPVLAGVTAFLLTKGTTEDSFNGANVEAVLENIQVADKDAQPVLKQIRDMEITGDKKTDDAIKAAVLKASMGEDTKTCNLRELSRAYIDLKNTKTKIQAIEDLTPPEEPVKVDYDVEKEPDVEVRTELPRMKFREGTWYTSHGYVNEDGSKLTEAERRQVQAELKKPDNKVALVDTNNDGKADFRDKKVSLPTEITLPSGKKVKIADDAYERIMKLPAKGGGGAGSYGVHVAKINGKWHVVDPSQNNKRIAGPFDTEAQARAKEKELEDAANNPEKK